LGKQNHEQDNYNLDHNLHMVTDYSWVFRGILSISKPLVKGSVYVMLTARGLRAKLIKLGKLAWECKTKKVCNHTWNVSLPGVKSGV